MSVRLEIDGRRGELVLDRPPLNVLDTATLERLVAAIATAAADRELQLLLVRGGGERAFSAGVAVQDHVAERIGPSLALFHRAVRELRALPAVTLAVVDGHCLGGGWELALACDLVVASERSRFALPEIDLGCYPPVAAALLPRLLGRPRAFDLMATGRPIDGVEAERLGLVSRVAAADRLEAVVEELAAALLARSRPVLRLLKRAVAEGEIEPFDPALAIAERIYLEELTETSDMHEGIAAFLAKRPADWRHE